MLTFGRWSCCTNRWIVPSHDVDLTDADVSFRAEHQFECSALSFFKSLFRLAGFNRFSTIDGRCSCAKQYAWPAIVPAPPKAKKTSPSNRFLQMIHSHYREHIHSYSVFIRQLLICWKFETISSTGLVSILCKETWGTIGVRPIKSETR